MAEPKSMESPGSGCGVPPQRSSQWCPEMVSVKLEDCSQPLEVNVIVIGEERAVKEEEMDVKEDHKEIEIKQEVEEKRAVKEEEMEIEKENKDTEVKEELEENAVIKEMEERGVKEDEETEVKKETGLEEEEEREVKEEEENRDVSDPDLEEEEAALDSIPDPGKFRCGVRREVCALAATGDSKTLIVCLLASTRLLNPLQCSVHDSNPLSVHISTGEKKALTPYLFIFPQERSPTQVQTVSPVPQHQETINNTDRGTQDRNITTAWTASLVSMIQRS